MSRLLDEMPDARLTCLESDVQIGQFAAGLLEVADLLMEAMDDPDPASRAVRVIVAIDDVFYPHQKVVWTERNDYYREIVCGRFEAKRKGGRED